MSGCDFVGSLPGIGIKKAHQHLRRSRSFLKVRPARLQRTTVACFGAAYSVVRCPGMWHAGGAGIAL
jgi:hypothetical protein